MHRFTLAIAAAAALLISGPAYAQGHGGGKSTKNPPTNHGSSATTHGNAGATTHGNSAATTTHGSSGASTHGQNGSHAAKTTTTSSNTHASNTTTSKNTKKSSKTAASNASGSNTTLTPVQQKLQKNTNLADKLRMRLPAGTDLMRAAEGFRNLGQFVAAVNVSANHEGVRFTELKTRMLDEGMSLGQALQDVKKLSKTAAQTEAQRAEAEADTMIKSSTNTTSTASNTTTKKKTAKSSTENK